MLSTSNAWNDEKNMWNNMTANTSSIDIDINTLEVLQFAEFIIE